MSRTLCFDVHGNREPPTPGDVLKPDWPRGVAWYRVLGVQPVESRKNPNRWRLRIERLTPQEIAAGPVVRTGGHTWPFAPAGYTGPLLSD